MPRCANVTACNTESVAEVLNWLYRDFPADERTERVNGALAEFSPGDVFASRDGNKLVGAIVARVAPGRVGWLWAPNISGELNESAAASMADSLTRAACEHLRRGGACIAQSLLSPDVLAPGWLRSGGFRFITELVHMERLVAGLPPRDSSRLVFSNYLPSLRDDLIRVIERTYQQSFDCPELDGIRRIADVLEGYEAAGVFRPDLWTLARRDDEFIGCVLLVHWPDEDRCEVQYMGVIPEARGNGFGFALCGKAIDDTRRLGASCLTLNVDERNEPALRQYAQAGFVEVGRWQVWIRQLESSGN